MTVPPCSSFPLNNIEEVTHITAYHASCRRREEAIVWLHIADPSIKGGLGKSRVLAALPDVSQM